VTGVQTCALPISISKSILNNLEKELPNYMIPKKVILLNDFPLNSNGKIDKKSLLKWLK